MTERRRLPRTKVAQPGKVLAGDADGAHDCTVENLNTLGACVSFDATTFTELHHETLLSTTATPTGIVW